MAKQVVPLTDARCKQSKFSTEGRNKLFDGGGLYLELLATGRKKWRLKYRRPGSAKENRLTFGDYPSISLPKAREARNTARAQLAAGIDPATVRDANREQVVHAEAERFRAIAEEWLVTRLAGWSSGYHKRIGNSLKANVYPYIGSRPISEIPGKKVLEVVQRVEQRGSLEMASRVLDAIGMVFKYAVGTGRVPADVTQGLESFLQPRPLVKHFPHVDETALPELLRRVGAYHGRPETRLALQLMMRTFPRTVELRWARWEEFDFDNAKWIIPSTRMKGRLAAKRSGIGHVIPLSRQVIQLLSELKRYSGRYTLLFPGIRDPLHTAMSAETINKALKIMGMEGKQTGHGFRGLASTIMNERSDIRAEVIERQLAHKEKDKIRRAYNHATYLDERRILMQWWSDYLEQKLAESAT